MVLGFLQFPKTPRNLRGELLAVVQFSSVPSQTETVLLGKLRNDVKVNMRNNLMGQSISFTHVVEVVRRELGDARRYERRTRTIRCFEEYCSV